MLRWQKRLHSKSKEEAQLVLNSNLEQIVRVRKSLETLSILLQDAPSPLDASGVLADLRDGDGGIVGNDPPSDDSIAGSIMAAAAAAARSTILGDSGSINQQYFHEDAT